MADKVLGKSEAGKYIKKIMTKLKTTRNNLKRALDVIDDDLRTLDIILRQANELQLAKVQRVAQLQQNADSAATNLTSVLSDFSLGVADNVR